MDAIDRQLPSLRTSGENTDSLDCERHQKNESKSTISPIANRIINNTDRFSDLKSRASVDSRSFVGLSTSPLTSYETRDSLVPKGTLMQNDREEKIALHHERGEQYTTETETMTTRTTCYEELLNFTHPRQQVIHVCDEVVFEPIVTHRPARPSLSTQSPNTQAQTNNGNFMEEKLKIHKNDEHESPFTTHQFGDMVSHWSPVADTNIRKSPMTHTQSNGNDSSFVALLHPQKIPLTRASTNAGNTTSIQKGVNPEATIQENLHLPSRGYDDYNQFRSERVRADSIDGLGSSLTSLGGTTVGRSRSSSDGDTSSLYSVTTIPTPPKDRQTPINHSNGHNRNGFQNTALLNWDLGEISLGANVTPSQHSNGIKATNTEGNETASAPLRSTTFRSELSATSNEYHYSITGTTEGRREGTLFSSSSFFPSKTASGSVAAAHNEIFPHDTNQHRKLASRSHDDSGDSFSTLMEIDGNMHFKKIVESDYYSRAGTALQLGRDTGRYCHTQYEQYQPEVEPARPTGAVYSSASNSSPYSSPLTNAQLPPRPPSTQYSSSSPYYMPNETYGEYYSSQHPTHGSTGNMYRLTPPPFVPSTPPKKIHRTMAPIDGMIYVVQFKRACRNFILCPDVAPFDIIVGDVVKVEADRGQDMGVVQSIVPVHEFEEFLPTAGYRGRGFSSGVGERKFLFGRATYDEQLLMMQQLEDEASVLETIRYKTQERALPMIIYDAEYQFDRHKLTIYFHAEHRVDFRDLVSDLFSLYKTRIWMQQVDPSSPNINNTHTTAFSSTLSSNRRIVRSANTGMHSLLASHHLQDNPDHHSQYLRPQCSASPIQLARQLDYNGFGDNARVGRQNVTNGYHQRVSDDYDSDRDRERESSSSFRPPLPPFTLQRSSTTASPSLFHPELRRICSDDGEDSGDGAFSSWPPLQQHRSKIKPENDGNGRLGTSRGINPINDNLAFDMGKRS